MSIVSSDFLFFTFILTVLYFNVPKKYQWLVILGGNIYFYYQVGIIYLILLIGVVAITFVSALRMDVLFNQEDKTKPKRLCYVTIFTIIGIWIIFKYSKFLFSQVFLISDTDSPFNNLILPLGISFYTLNLIGYLLDVLHHRINAEHNFLKLLTYISYFPHIIQGPFSRYSSLATSIFEKHYFSYERTSEGCARILWGFFKKLVIADKLRVVTNSIFQSYVNHSSITILFSMIIYSIELYADFSGYMDIVCGLSHILGIELTENFNIPYFSKSIEEFWRRWHITLGAWFRDYLFYPLSTSKRALMLSRSVRKKYGSKLGKLSPSIYALFFVWTATGLWHGVDWTYLIWGYLNMITIILSMLLTDFYVKLKKSFHISEDPIWTIFSIIRTFMLVCLFRFFSNGMSLSGSLAMFKHMITVPFHLSDISFKKLFVGLESLEICIIIISILVLFIVDILKEKDKWVLVKNKCPLLLRDFIYALLIILVILMSNGSSDLTGGFLYEHF